MPAEPRNQNPPPLGEPSTFSLTGGGPFFHLVTYLGLRTETSMVRTWWLAFVIWIPVLIGTGARAVLGLPIDPTVLDLSLHVRLLFTLPILLSSEMLLEQCTKSAMTSLYNGNFIDRDRIDPIARRAERLRDSWVVELTLLGIAILGGQFALWGVFGTTGLFSGEAEVGFWSFPRVWYAIVGLPLVQFLMFRWLWRWLIWSYMVARISRLPLSLVATHGDSAGGLAALARPVTGFSAFVMANSAILSAAWATQLIAERTTLQALLPMLAIFCVSVLVVAVGPLLLLCGHLFRTRRRTLAQYGDFMREYALQFHTKWIDRPWTEQPLGTSDIQSLADIGNSYAVIVKTRVVAFGPRTVFSVWLSALLPMLPLLASTVTFEDVLQRVFRTVIGGFPI